MRVSKVSKEFLGPFLFVAVLGFLDLFSLRTQTEALSEQVLIQILAPWYPEPGNRLGDRASPITVVNLDRDFLERVDASWPLAFSDHAYLLRRLGRYEPSVIFLDIFFMDHRGDPSETELLYRQIERLEQDGIPVLVAAPNPCLIDVGGEDRVQEHRPGRGLLQEIDSAAVPVTADWASYGDTYPLVIDVRRFESAVDTEHRCAAVEEAKWPTPALAIFAHHCERQPMATCPAGLAGGHHLEDRFEEPMILRWGSEVPLESGVFASLADCGLVNPSPGERVAWAIDALFGELLSGLTRMGEKSYERCPAIASLRGAALYPVDAEGNAVFADEYEERLSELLRDRAVLVGTNLLGTGDVVVSPVHGRLPGVYVHATALDNLVRFGDEYWREPWHPFWSATLLDALEFVILSAVLWVFAWYNVSAEEREQAGKKKPSPRHPLARALGYLALWMVASFTLLAGAMGLLLLTHASPMNWLGLAAVLVWPLERTVWPVLKGWWEARRGEEVPDGSSSTDATSTASD